MEPEELRPARSASPEARPAPRPQRPERPDRQDPPESSEPSGPASGPRLPEPAIGQPKPRIGRRTLLAAGAVALAALIVPRLFHSNPQPLPPPAGQAGPEYQAATVALQAAPTEAMPANLSSWKSCIGSVAGGLSDLDLAIVVDNTGSMSPVINDVKANIGQLISTLRSGAGRVRVGMVAYRDFGDDFVVRPFPLTDLAGPGAYAVQGFMALMQAHGGGDWPEKLDAALQVAADMAWRQNVPASIVVIADAPAHAADRAAVSSAVRSFLSRVPQGQISVVDTGSGGDAFLRSLPGAAHGQYVTYDGSILKSLYPAITACPGK